ncbi:MAG TPA: S1C family serine protease [Acidimicrobiales bacterium]|nr:S1C family serine protease [Acidimicrobiales bacterium]
MTGLEELQHAVARVADSVAGSVVRIGRGPGRGAGVVVGDGTVLTNAHNLRGSETAVSFADGRVERGAVAGVDVDSDLAVLHVQTAGATPVEWREGGPAIGTAVFAVTSPSGAGSRITVGTVSSSGRSFRGPRGRLVANGLEHTAPMPRGSSGSPVVDTTGKLVGINTHRLGEGFYLAIPADSALRERVDALARGESPTRRYLGLALLPPRAARRLRAAVGLPDRNGLLVRAVDEEGPAARAGVRAGDLLVEAGGRELGSPDDLFEVLAALADDESLTVRVVRGTDDVEVRVDFDGPGAERPGTA